MQGLDKPFSIELQLRKNHSQSASRLISRRRCKQCFHTVCLSFEVRPISHPVLFPRRRLMQGGGEWQEFRGMADESVLRDLFDRWERVWHEGKYDLVPECLGGITSGTTKPVTGR